MITRERIVKCAEAIVKGMNLKRGEAVVVRGGTHAQELLEEIAILCFKKGAQPLIPQPATITSLECTRRYLLTF